MNNYCISKNCSSRVQISRLNLKNVFYFTAIAISLLSVFSAAQTKKYDVTINGIKAQVWASSELASAKNPGIYSPAKAFDGDNATAWVEGAKEKGTGEFIEIQFTDTVSIDGFYFKPGYTKDLKTFSENLQPTIINVTVDQRNLGFYHIPYKYQYFDTLNKQGCLPDLNPINLSTRVVVFEKTIAGKTLRFAVKGAVEGTSRYSDLAISELALIISGKELPSSIKTSVDLIRKIRDRSDNISINSNLTIDDLTIKLIISNNTLESKFKGVKYLQLKTPLSSEHTMSTEEAFTTVEFKTPDSLFRVKATTKKAGPVIYSKFINYCRDSFVGSVVTVFGNTSSTKLIGMKSCELYAELISGETLSIEYYPTISIDNTGDVHQLKETPNIYYAEPFCYMSFPDF